ncbi:MAG: esterase/lipase-like protein [Chitinophagaceae bacterium]|nr:esterase/lipase-like protein [Chitinophagaceae bacterium]
MHFFTTILLAIVCSNSFAQRVIPLYGANIPNSQNINAEDQINADKSVYYRIVDPSLIVYLPSRQSPNNKTAVIICPGGGYATLQIKREGYDIAEAFNRIGVTAFILKYRLPDDKTNTDKTVAPLQDAQQAIKMVRDSAAKWNLDQGKIGIMGFSAGGHLASSAGVHYKDVLIDNATKKTLCPDFMLLVYPVISFGEAYGHIGSRDNLIGKNPSADLIKYFSNELHADQNTPPTFLVHAGDDNIVPVANSIKFYEALQKNGVNAELHIYAKGGHGFGSIPTFEEWFGRCLQWMRTAQLIQ